MTWKAPEAQFPFLVEFIGVERFRETKHRMFRVLEKVVQKGMFEAGK
jgi:hypothetical protein